MPEKPYRVLQVETVKQLLINASLAIGEYCYYKGGDLYKAEIGTWYLLETYKRDVQENKLRSPSPTTKYILRYIAKKRGLDPENRSNMAILASNTASFLVELKDLVEQAGKQEKPSKDVLGRLTKFRSFLQIMRDDL